MSPVPDDMPTCGDWAPSGLNGRLRESRERQPERKGNQMGRGATRPGKEAIQPLKEGSQPERKTKEPEKESRRGKTNGIEEENEVLEKFFMKLWKNNAFQRN